MHGRLNGRYSGTIGRGRGREGRRQEHAFKYQRTDPTMKMKTASLGLESEHNKQTLTQFWEQLHKEFSPKYPNCACLLIDGVPTPLVVPVLPVAPPGNAAAIRIWEHTILKGYTNDVESNKKEIKDRDKEQTSMCGELKQYVTTLLNDRLTSHYPMNNVGAPIWTTTDKIAEAKLMICTVHNASKSVLPQQRIEMAKRNFDWIKMLEHQSLDIFAHRFRQGLIERNQSIAPYTEQEKCYQFLSKLTSEYEAIRSDIAIGESKNEIRRAAGQAVIDGAGYPTTLDELILQIQASKESSTKSKTTGKQAVSYLTLAGRGRGNGRGAQTGSNAQAGRTTQTGRGAQASQTYRAYNNHYSNDLKNIHTGVIKKFNDMTKDDNPVDYGRNPCKECQKHGVVGLHFHKFHV